MDPRYDLVIIGGGIIGAWSAYLAATSHPEWTILLIDRGLIGAANATTYSAALAPHYGNNPQALAMSRRSLELYRASADELNLPLYDIEFVWLSPAGMQAQMLAKLEAPGRPAGALLEAHPYIRVFEDHTAVVTTVLGCSAPAELTRRLIEQATRASRASCWEGAWAKELHTSGRNCEVVLADGRSVTAARAIVATGPWVLDGPGGGAAWAAGIRRKKIVAFHIDSPPPPRAPVFVFYDEQAFLLPWADGSKWLLSITSEEWDCDPEPNHLFITRQELERARALLARVAPSLVPHCNAGRVFSDAYSKDGVPCIGGQEGRWAVATGGSGAGFRLAPAIAEQALAWLGAATPAAAAPPTV